MTTTFEHDPLGHVVDCARRLIAVWEPWTHHPADPVAEPMEDLRTALMILDQTS